ncbi:MULTISPECIES: hypothetical protein [Anaerotruncus]|uniref:Uncharacterized protein n=1 Tax=Anaerotruncus massiliensis (ex Togo et al. 2019) TaxID=1673720 RepID=A0ABR7AGQ0_9FIRM|nr:MULTISPECIES: hypothetical protein [Anaerotruncus]MBC3939639.1 hypothetical protein [Anaerotruncus massiliensis (ex Togo et al. 2019)]
MKGSLSRRFAATVSDETKVFGVVGRFFKSAPRRASQSAERFSLQAYFSVPFYKRKRNIRRGGFPVGKQPLRATYWQDANIHRKKPRKTCRTLSFVLRSH